MILTFKGLTKPEEYLVAGIFPVPKYGCITVNENDAYFRADKELRQKREAGELSEAQANNELTYVTATAIIQSRLDPGWTMEDTKRNFWPVMVDGVEHQQISTPLITGLSDFFLLEFAAMSEPTTEEDENKGTGKPPRGRRSSGD